jgi:protein SCO1/2
LHYASFYDGPRQQYAHAAGITVLDAGGRVRAMLPGLVFPPQALRAALSGTSPATGPAPRWLLCFHYDPQTGRYSVPATTAAGAAGLGGVAALGLFVVRMRRRRNERNAAS